MTDPKIKPPNIFPGGRLQTRIRYLKLAKALVEGKSYKEACEIAGYKGTNHDKRNGIIHRAQPVIQEIMMKAGITPEAIASKLRELMDAKQYRPMKTGKGIVSWEAPDPGVQQKNMELITEIMGHRRWGMPGTMNTQNLVQVNVSFGGNAQETAHADGQKALPVTVHVRKGGDDRPEEIEPFIDMEPAEEGP